MAVSASGPALEEEGDKCDKGQGQTQEWRGGMRDSSGLVVWVFSFLLFLLGLFLCCLKREEEQLLCLSYFTDFHTPESP